MLRRNQRSPQYQQTLAPVAQPSCSLCVETAFSSCLSKEGAFETLCLGPPFNKLNGYDKKTQDPGDAFAAGRAPAGAHLLNAGLPQSSPSRGDKQQVFPGYLLTIC